LRFRLSEALTAGAGDSLLATGFFDEFATG
jgi:hypothetical protein